MSFSGIILNGSRNLYLGIVLQSLDFTTKYLAQQNLLFFEFRLYTAIQASPKIFPAHFYGLKTHTFTASHGREQNRNIFPVPAFTCSNLTMETLEQGVKYFLFFCNWDSHHARLNSHYKASQSYKKKKHKKIKAYRKCLLKEPTVNRCLLILDLKRFRLQVKGKQSIGREFLSLAVRGKKLLT